MALQNAFENLAVESKQDAEIALLATIDASNASIDTNTGSTATNTAAIAGDTSGISADTAIISGSIHNEDTAAVSGDAGVGVLGVRNDAAAALTSADGDYSHIAVDDAGRVGITGLGDPLDVNITGGTVATGGLTDAQLRATPVPVSGTVTVTDGAGPLTVDGSVSITGSVAVTGPLTDTQLRATPVPVSGTVTANIGTTNGLALDATLTGGTQKAINRGGAKGATVAADVTSTAQGANHQGLDVAILDASGALVSPLTDTQLRATPVPVSGTVTSAAQKLEDSAAANADPGIPVFGVRNDAAAATTSANGDYSWIAVDSAGRVGITALGTAVSVTDAALATTNSSLSTINSTLSGGTPVMSSQIVGTTVVQLPSQSASVEVIITARINNPGVVYIGDDNTVTASISGNAGIDLGPGDSITMLSSNANNSWAIATAANCYLGITTR